MPETRVVFLWHMHQPFYKDLVTGEYRLAWVRLHGLKDYFGMVKLLDEFPGVHQTFNLVPSLIVQLQDYVAGNARDFFLEIAAKPAKDLSPEERRFALTHLFQANPKHLIGRFPRYRELWLRFMGVGQNPRRAEQYFQTQDYTDLQVLSQLVWFDEFFLQEPAIAELVRKGKAYSLEDQRFVIDQQRHVLGLVLPAYKTAMEKGTAEISTSPFYHPILPLLCDTDQGAVSAPKLSLPSKRFRYPEDAREQLKRGLDLHEKVFGKRPAGAWPSEGSVSQEAIAIAHQLGIRWMATDEGVLGRSLGVHFERDSRGRLADGPAEKLYTPYHYEQGGAEMKMIFRDHSLSDLIGFVYSGMPVAEAARHFVRSIKESTQQIEKNGSSGVVAIILDGENAWEFYPHSGREFLRRVYDTLQNNDLGLRAVTVSEALAEQREFPELKSLVPGSWINANFNVWIGSPEDNRSWEYLTGAREFFSRTSPSAPAKKRDLAFEELLIAEGSDWNWWYGPEHHSANDRDFDELYRKHLSNVYQLLGAEVPVHLAQPIAAGVARPIFVPQTAFIRPRIGSIQPRYFDWIGAAMYTADRHSGAMHGKVFLLDSVYVGIDEVNLYGRLDFAGGIPEDEFEIAVDCEVRHALTESAANLGPAINQQEAEPTPTGFRLEMMVDSKRNEWLLRRSAGEPPLATGANAKGVTISLRRNFEFSLPLELIGAGQDAQLRLRFSLWRHGLPIDALPLEGSIYLQVASETELAGNIYNYTASG